MSSDAQGDRPTGNDVIAQYIRLFKDAYVWTNEHTDPNLNYPMVIRPEASVDMPSVTRALAKDFAEFVANTDCLPGCCFPIAREVSYVLFQLRIPHAVTIGDIELADKYYVGLSKESLIKELDAGYVIHDDESGRPASAPANSHAWITLENGQIIDATILASQHRKGGGPPLAFADVFYYFGRPNSPNMRRVPFMTGFAYHYNVLTNRFDKMGPTYLSWYDEHFRFMEFMDHACEQ